MRKILITGGAGFIGFHLARLLAVRGDVQLTIVDNLQRGRMDEDLQRLIERPDVRFVQMDLTDPAAYANLDRDFDQVYHLAAVNGTKHFYKAPGAVLRTNTLTLVHLLDWVASLEKRPKVLFTSSNEAYGGALSAFNQLPLPTPEDVPLVIEDPKNARWSYAATKLIGELFVIHYAKQYGFPAVVVRPHNFYGPRAGYDHVIPEMIARIGRRESPFGIYGPDETRSFCYIDDAVEAMRQLMDTPEVGAVDAVTVHIGSDEETRIDALAEALFSVADWSPDRLESLPSPVGSVKRRLADISRIRALTGWEPRVGLADGLRRTYAWYAEHPKPTVPAPAPTAA